MSLYVIGDLHLSLGTDKPMNIFAGWDNYAERLEKNWRETVSPDDTVVIPGDISWAMKLGEAYDDFRFIHGLPGRKIISKGNHDYWWTTVAKMNRFLETGGMDSINILHNNHYSYENYGICGTRGWIAENGEPEDARVLAREAARLETSLLSAENEGLEPIVFLHYPPVYGNTVNYSIMEVLHKHNIKCCYYGHIHGRASALAVNGVYDGIMFNLISSDYIQFKPVKIM